MRLPPARLGSWEKWWRCGKLPASGELCETFAASVTLLSMEAQRRYACHLGKRFMTLFYALVQIDPIYPLPYSAGRNSYLKYNL